MRIAVNTRLLLKDRLEGIGWFTYETFKRISQSHPEHEFFFIFDRPFNSDFVFGDNITPVIAYPQARHPILHYIWFEHSIPKKLKRIKPDLFISPDAYCSLRTDVKTLIVIHDLNFEHFPEHLPFMARNYYRYFTPRYARKANRIATVSNYSKHDIVDKYNINPEKIDVIYNGVSDIYEPVDDKAKQEVKNEVSSGNDYFIFIGALNPRKNLYNLFKAFDLYKTKSKSDHKLVVVGEKMYWPQDIKRIFDNMVYKNDVLFVGRKGINELAKLVAASIALTFVSYFEGFGIPLVEAFRAGTPVITSNTSSMPEIAGEAALIVDPYSVGEIADAMEKFATDNQLRKLMIAKGLERAELFSWDNSAENLWRSALKTMNKS